MDRMFPRTLHFHTNFYHTKILLAFLGLICFFERSRVSFPGILEKGVGKNYPYKNQLLLSESRLGGSKMIRQGETEWLHAFRVFHFISKCFNIYLSVLYTCLRDILVIFTSKISAHITLSLFRSDLFFFPFNPSYIMTELRNNITYTFVYAFRSFFEIYIHAEIY